MNGQCVVSFGGFAALAVQFVAYWDLMPCMIFRSTALHPSSVLKTAADKVYFPTH
jgi:hypothetical protein